MENKRNLLIIIAFVILVILGLAFIFRLDKKIADIFTSNSSNNAVSYGDIGNNTDVVDVIKIANIKNAIKIQGSTFSPDKIVVKKGENVNFVNYDNNPQKVIGKDWQSPYLDKTGMFSYSFTEKGVYEFYLENFPQIKGEVTVR